MKKPNRISILLISILFTLVTVGISNAAPNSSSGNFSGAGEVGCKLLGGTVDKQPPGSPIITCCFEDGCQICDKDWSDCYWDPAIPTTPEKPLKMKPNYSWMKQKYKNSQRANQNRVELFMRKRK